jgi:hypothetical protein
VLVSAASFGDLVTRYKYLHELALRRPALVAAWRSCATTSRRSTAARALRAELERNRAEQAAEQYGCSALETQREREPGAGARRGPHATRPRADRARRDPAGDVIASLESARRRAESRPSARPAAPSTLQALGRAGRATGR